MSTNQRKKPSYTSHNGFLMPCGFPKEGFISGLEYESEEGDIFIATYPKCGTTWTLHIVWLILNRGEPFPSEKKLDQALPHLEEVGKEFVSSLFPPRIIKTHLPYQITPNHPKAKYIYIARNPFDCAVSFYHHTRGFIKHYNFEDGSFEDFFECFISGEVDFGDYFENILSWYKVKDNDNILFLTFEDMKKDTSSAIIKIAEFLGPEHKDTVSDSKILNKILDHSSFKSMSQNQNRWASKRPDHMPPFIRKGKVGDWRNYFSKDQHKKLIDKLGKKAKDIKQLWKPEILSL